MYSLDAKKIGKSEQINNRITETGAYKGRIVHAIDVTAKTGTKGIELAFKADDGRTADYLTFYVQKADGEELMGMAILQDLMMVTELRAITPKSAKLVRRENGADVEVDATVFPELAGKRVGLVLVKAEYQKNDGSIGNKMEIVFPFEADTDRTAREKASKAQKAEALTLKLPGIKDRTLKPQKGGKPAAQASYGAAPAGPDFDDDLPF